MQKLPPTIKSTERIIQSCYKLHFELHPVLILDMKIHEVYPSYENWLFLVRTISFLQSQKLEMIFEFKGMLKSSNRSSVRFGLELLLVSVTN